MASEREAGTQADREQRPEDLLRELIRAHPAACLIGSALLGYLAARLLRDGEPT